MAVETRGGVTIFVCGTRSRGGFPLCSSCKSAPGEKLCDYPVKRPTGKSQTCDRAICNDCATSVGANKDYCPPHSNLARKIGAPEVIAAAPKEQVNDYRYPHKRPVKIMSAKFNSKCAECRRWISQGEELIYLPAYYLTGIGNLKSAAICERCEEALQYGKYATEI